LLDPAYFAYYEDADWCRRCRQAGFRVIMAYEAQVYHKGTPDRLRQPLPSFWYYYTRNQRLFGLRHMPKRRQAVLLMRFIRTSLQAARGAWQAHDTEGAEAVLDGLWAGVLGRFGAQRQQLASPLKAVALRLAPAVILAITGLEALARRWPIRAGNQPRPAS
jgi:hypothetical protein